MRRWVMVTHTATDGRPAASEVLLRYVLTVTLLDAPRDRSMTVAELAGAVEHGGFRIEGRAGKVISDALRWEVRRGRVVRVGRNQYKAGPRVPRSTEHRMRTRIATARGAPGAACRP
ncbi:MAG TPA: hypothetical protein VM345_05690 [Acidimicrobiales bacterium]|nr:hypothetical protein [Acidimicrobiales bacterium]